MTLNHNEGALFQWFSITRQNSIPLSGDIYKAKAKKLAEDLAEYEMLWNPTLSLQFGGFDRHGECPSPHERTNNGNDNEHSCCGVYPDRYP